MMEAEGEVERVRELSKGLTVMKELSEDLKDAVAGSETAARVFSLRKKLVEREEELTEEMEHRQRAERLLMEKEMKMEEVKNNHEMEMAKAEATLKARERSLEELRSESTTLRNRVEGGEEQITKYSEHYIKARDELDQLREVFATEKEKWKSNERAMTIRYEEAEQSLALQKKQKEELERLKNEQIKVLEVQVETEKKRRTELEQSFSHNAMVASESLKAKEDAEKLKEIRDTNSELLVTNRRLEGEVQILLEQIRQSSHRYEEKSNMVTVEQQSQMAESIKVLQTKLAEQQVELEHLHALREEKRKLSELIARLTPAASVSAGMTVLEALAEGKSLSTVDKTGETSQELNELRLKSSKLQSELGKQVAMTDSQTSALIRLERRSKVLEKERKALRSIIEAYEEDLPSSVTGDKKSELIKTLEESLKATEANVTSLEDELRSKDDMLQKASIEAVELKARIYVEDKDTAGADVLRTKLLEAIKEKDEFDRRLKQLTSFEEENTQLKLKISNLEENVKSLVEKTESGREKILRFKNNPSMALKKDEKETSTTDRKRPRTENEADDGDSIQEVADLRKRVKELEHSASQSIKEEVTRAVADAEKRALRTREVARMKIEEFRLACYNLFGYKMQVHGAKYKLSSMYAEREEDFLCFGRNESGGMELLETPYCGKLQEELEQFLRRWNSIPALLAHITTDNFQKTTSFLSS